MSFIEERLLDQLAFGFSGGPTWNTLVKTLRNRHERRNVQASRPQHKFSGSFDRREAGIIEVLLSTYNATYGAAYSFRFKNYLDYEATAEALPAGTGVAQSVQLTKSYSFGGQSTLVPIRKPNAGVVITEDGTTIASTVDTTTGIATFTAAPGSVIAWSGTFDVPVRFGNDEFSATMETWNATSVDIQLIEDLSA
jgi:uncharacterized protein (TIGR02217 family)